MQGRLAWLDSAKGLGIILVVFAHIYMGEAGYNFINSFHMPLFFFLSGFLFNGNKYFAGAPLIRSRARSLLLPYLSFSLVTYAYWLVIERSISGSDFSPALAFVNIFLAQGGDAYLPHNPPLWFLPCLFLTTVAFYYLAKTFTNNFHLLLALIASSLVGFGLSLTFESNWPWNLDGMFTAMVFFGMGYLSRGYFLGREYLTGRYGLLMRLVAATGLLGLAYGISQLNSPVGLADNACGNYFLFYIAAGAGIGAILLLARVWQNSAGLRYLGLNSLIIFGLHFPIKRAVMGLTSIVGHLEMDTIRTSLWLSSLDTILVLLILVPIIYLVNNYLAFFIGKSSPTAKARLPKDSVAG